MIYFLYLNTCNNLYDSIMILYYYYYLKNLPLSILKLVNVQFKQKSIGFQGNQITMRDETDIGETETDKINMIIRLIR